MWMLLLAALTLTAQEAPEPKIDADLLRLARIKVHMGANLQGLPNYTCTQTIERSRRLPRSRRFELQDTLRLEVALVEGKELFSWPGSGRFEDKEMRDLVGNGTFGNGNFAIHARSVFLSNAPRFSYEGIVEENGRKLFQYSYDVPQMLSGYRIRSGDAEAIVAYHGTFQVDARTLDLVELDVITDEIPPHVPISRTSSLMRYLRLPIGSGDFLLPLSSLLTVADMLGGESRNQIQFNNCRQYATESVISFADPPPEVTDAPPPVIPRKLELPEGLSLDLRLETPVKFGSSAIGDPLTATVASNVKRQGEIVVPKGAVVKGRVTRIQKTFFRTEIITFGLIFDEITFPGAYGELHARLEDAGPSILPNARVVVMEPPAEDMDQGTISLRGNRLELGKGFRMLWRTQSK